MLLIQRRAAAGVLRPRLLQRGHRGGPLSVPAAPGSPPAPARQHARRQVTVESQPFLKSCHHRASTPSWPPVPRARCGLAASADPACGWCGSLPTALPPPASDHAVLSAVVSPFLHPLRLTRAGADRGRDNFESIKVGGRKSGGAAAAASVEGCEGKCLKGCETSCPRQHSDASTRSKCVDDCGFECHELCRPQVGAGSARSHRTSSLRAWPMSLNDLTPSSSIGKPIFVFNWTYPLITLSHSHGVSNLGETTRSAR